MKKINGISKSMYDEIEHDNLFRVTFEEDNIQNYVMQVFEELHQKNVNLSSDQYKRDRKEDPKIGKELGKSTRYEVERID